MENEKQDVYFSVVIPTRNRPELFKLALDSVLAQSFEQMEVIVVNDGSTQEYLSAYEEIMQEAGEKASFNSLLHRPNGHGQSYSMNYGASLAKGKYVCFLDDDDFWTDKEHLSRAYKSLCQSAQPVGLYYTNQDAYFADGRKQTENVWIEDLKSNLGHLKSDSEGSYRVDVPFLVTSQGFAHLNCSIFLKDLYEQIGGMDENIRYECDRDIYIRAIDAAEVILYNPVVISKHHIPDTSKKDNMSTLVSFSEKLIYQVRVYDKGVASCQKPELVTLCRYGKMYVLKKLAEGFEEREETSRAAFFAGQALGIRFSFKWFLYTLLLSAKSLSASKQRKN